MDQQSADSVRPGWSKLLAEIPAMARLVAAQFSAPRARGEQGQGRPVLVIPGFLGSDVATRLLRRSLAACGYAPSRWTLGFNLGARRKTFDRLLDRIDWLYAKHRRPLALVGWSLGGLYARELAKRRPDKVSLVITLGTPFSRSLRLTNARKLYNAINDHRVEHPPIAPHPGAKPAARTIAMWSRRDGLVAPAAARGLRHEVDQSVELHCRHHEFLCAPEAIAAVMTALSDWASARGPANPLRPAAPTGKELVEA